MFGRKGLNAGDGGAPRRQAEADRPPAETGPETPACHPLVLATRVVGFLSPPLEPNAPDFITVADIDHPVICEARSGDGFVAGLSFSFVGERGEEGIAYLYPEFAAIWPKPEQRPRPQIPAEMLRKHVPQYTEAVLAVMQKIRPPLDPVAQQQSEWIRGQLKQFLG